MDRGSGGVRPGVKLGALISILFFGAWIWNGTPARVSQDPVLTEWARDIPLAIGAGWVFFVYWTTRQGQVTIGIEPSFRFHKHNAATILLIKLRITNPSKVLFTAADAIATLIDASALTDSPGPPRRVRLAPFAEADPLLPVFSSMTDNAQAIQDGMLFRGDTAGMSLEPGEFIDTEVAFVLEDEEIGLMAMQVQVRGTQKTFLRGDSEPFWWATFFYIDPPLASPPNGEVH